LLDDLDEFVGFVAVGAGVAEKVFGLFDEGAVFGGACDRDAAAAAELEQAFVSELAEGAEDGVGVDAEDGDRTPSFGPLVMRVLVVCLSFAGGRIRRVSCS